MSMQAIELQPALLLHQRAYRDSSVIADLLTESYGRIALVAKGVRNIRSPLKSILQPFAPLLISCRGKQSLMTLTSAEATQLPFQLMGKALWSGFYLNELLLHLLHPFDEHPIIFTAYQTCLQQLQQIEQLETALRIFEKTFLNELGYGIDFQFEADHRTTIQPDRTYRFKPRFGFVASPEAQDTFLGAHLLAIESHCFDSTILMTAKKIFRAALQDLLGHKPLKTQLIFSQMTH